jgi:hypothetical protein
MLVLRSPNRGHSSLLMWFQKSVPYLLCGSMLWSQYITFTPSIGLLCWLEKRRPEDLGLALQLRGLSGMQMGPRHCGKLGPESMDSLWEKALYLSIGKRATVFRPRSTQSWPVLTKFKCHARPKQYISICSDSRGTLKALQSAKTTSPLVQQCRKALNGISTQYSVGLFWISVHSELREIKLPMGSQGRELFTSLLDRNRPWGSVDNTRKKIKRWIYNQHMEMWWDLSSRPT